MRTREARNRETIYHFAYDWRRLTLSVVVWCGGSGVYLFLYGLSHRRCDEPSFAGGKAYHAGFSIAYRKIKERYDAVVRMIHKGPFLEGFYVLYSHPHSSLLPLTRSCERGGFSKKELSKSKADLSFFFEQKQNKCVCVLSSRCPLSWKFIFYIHFFMIKPILNLVHEGFTCFSISAIFHLSALADPSSCHLF